MLDTQIYWQPVRTLPRACISVTLHTPPFPSPMFEQAFRNIDDALRKEAGCATELDYAEQTSSLLFLKYLDGLEDARAAEVALEGRNYTHLLEKPYRWETWAAPKDKSGQRDHNNALTGVQGGAGTLGPAAPGAATGETSTVGTR